MNPCCPHPTHISGTAAMPRFAILLGMALLLTSCASIPLSTMWKMRNFGPEDLARVQPREVRMAARIDPSPLRVDATRSYLRLTLHPIIDEAPPEIHDFSLEPADGSLAQLVPDGDSRERWAVFAFDEAGIAAWQRLQPKLQSLKQDYQGASFSFQFKTESPPLQGTDAMVVSARLLLNPDQGVLTLMDHTRVNINKD